LDISRSIEPEDKELLNLTAEKKRIICDK